MKPLAEEQSGCCARSLAIARKSKFAPNLDQLDRIAFKAFIGRTQDSRAKIAAAVVVVNKTRDSRLTGGKFSLLRFSLCSSSSSSSLARSFLLVFFQLQLHLHLGLHPQLAALGFQLRLRALSRCWLIPIQCCRVSLLWR